MGYNQINSLAYHASSIQAKETFIDFVNQLTDLWSHQLFTEGMASQIRMVKNADHTLALECVFEGLDRHYQNPIFIQLNQ